MKDFYKYTKEDFDKAIYFVNVALKFYNYTSINEVNDEERTKVLELAQLIQTEVHKSELKIINETIEKLKKI